MKAEDVKTPTQAVDFYRDKATDYMRMICLCAEMDDIAMANLLIGSFYNPAIKNMEHFEGLL